MVVVVFNFVLIVIVKVYKNGNCNFFGKMFVINRCYIWIMDVLYDEVIMYIVVFNVVWKICILIGGWLV